MIDKNKWTTKTLGECFVLIRNGANIKQSSTASGIPITRIETLANSVFNRDRMGYADIFELGKYSSYALQEGDILMSHINSFKYVGRSVIYHKVGDEVIIHGMNLFKLVVNRDLLFPTYANYYFQSEKFHNLIVSISKQSVHQVSFNVTELKKLPLPVPPLSVQEHIVAELDALSGVMEKKRRQLHELDLLAQSLFFSFFGDPVVNDKGWKVSDYQSIFNVTSGGTPSKSVKEYWNDGDIPWVGSNMCNNTILYETDGKTITQLGLDNSSAKIFPVNTILIALVGATIGKTSLLAIPTSTNQNVAGLQIKDKNKMDPTFCFYHTQKLYPLFMDIGKDKFTIANQGFIKKTSHHPPSPLVAA